MCNKVVDTSASAIQFSPECYKTHKMCYKAVDTCALTFGSVLDYYRTQEIVFFYSYIDTCTI